MSRSLLIPLLALVACTPEKPTREASRHDALSTDVVISEVYGGGGSGTSAYRSDFVELFNRGNAPVNISNWSVQYTSDTGGGWQVNSLGNFGSLQPGRSLLLRLGTSGPAGAALPTPDVTGGSTMSSTAGKVALVSSTTALTTTCPMSTRYVDLVGYGTTANCSETAPTPDTSSTTSVGRLGNGCVETDSNSQDFALGGPTPRNTSASAMTCGSSGVDAGCLTIATWPGGTRAGGHDPVAETTFGELSSATSDGGVDLLTLEAYFGFGLTLPGNETYTTASRFGTCEVCASLSRGCRGPGSCAKEYFSQAGSGAITRADRDAGAGRIIGSLTGVRFVEWDFMVDQAVSGGECVVLSAANVDVTWGGAVDAGPTGGGGATGGGGGAATGGGGGGATGGGGGAMGGGTGGGAPTGGGGGTTDAGTTEPDAGMGEPDAGAGGGNDKLGTRNGCGCATGSELLLLLGAMLLRRRAQ